MKRTFHIFSLAIIVSLLVSAVGLSAIPAQAAGAWEFVGAPGFSAGQADDISFVLDNGTPYVAYTDYGNGNRASVMKFDGTDWVYVGTPGFSAADAYRISLAVDNGTPYVAYQDGYYGKASVMKFDGTNWVYVGAAGFSSGMAFDTSLVLDSGTPYVVYQDGYHGKASVMKFNGTNWVYVGTAGFSAGEATYTTLILNNGIPYVAYSDYVNGDKASVMKFDGTNWIYVGTAGFSAGNISAPSLAVDNGIPYIAYMDSVNGDKASVMKFNGTNWVYVGAAGFSAGKAYYTSLALDNGTPYLAYTDLGNAWKASVMKFDAALGVWVYVGTAGFSSGVVDYTFLVLDQGAAYIAFMDGANDAKATVMRFMDGSSPTCYALTLSHTGQGSNPTASPANSTGCPDGQYVAGATINLSGATPNSGWLITGWTGTNNNSSTSNSNTLTMPANSYSAGVIYMAWVAGTWEYVGPAGFADADPVQISTSLAFDSGIPYVAYTDYAYGDKASVMKFNGTGWVYVGPAGFSSGFARPISLVFDNGVPYVAFADQTNKANVMKFDTLSGNWVYVGPASFSIGSAGNISLAFNGGTPFVAYSGGSSSKLFVEKFDASSGNWIEVGTTGFSGGITRSRSLVFDNGTPYLAYTDYANAAKASVMKFDALSGSWVNVGPAGFSSGTAEYVSLAVDTGIPYILYRDGANSNKASVMKFDAPSGDWVNVGPAGFSAGQVYDLSLIFSSGKPYVAYADWGSPFKANVMKFDALSGNWVYVGPVGFSSGAAYSLSFAFDNGMPYVTFSEGTGTNYKTSVMRFVGESSATCYALTLAHTGQGSDPIASPANSTGCPTGQYVAGATINLSGASPTTGWQIASWTGTNSDGSTTSTNTLTMPASARTVNVNYSQIEYTLTITSAHGTVTKNPNKTTYHNGDIVQLTAAAATGWTFTNWSGDATGSSNPVSVTINANKAVTANYTQNCYALTLSHSGQGTNPTATPTKSTACSTNGQYVAGASISLSGASPTTGWQIGSWTGTNNDSSTAATNSLTMPAGARTVSVNYTQIGYTLTVTSAHGTVTKSPDKATYTYGEVVQLTAAPAAGWSFANWTGDATGPSNPVSITINGNKAVTANYAQIEYTLNITSAHGTVTKNPDKVTYHYGDVVQLTVAPATGWYFVNWTGDATGSNNPVSVTVNGNKAVTANYTQTGYTLSLTSAHGTITKSPDKATYTYGDVVQLTAVPAAGWSFVSWSGDAAGTSNPVSITIDGNKTVTANYALMEYTLTITSAHGIVTKTPDKATYHYGDVVQLTAAPATDWSFANWSGDATGTNNPVSITIDGNKAITATYTQNGGYTLTIASTHGTVTKTPDKAIYGYGEVVQLTAKPDRDWLFVNWSGDLTGTTNPLSVTMDGNKNITANFMRSGADTTGVFRPINGIIFLKHQNTTGYADVALNYGIPGDYPVIGDWDGDGDATIGVYRNGKFMLRNSNTIGFADMVFAFGQPGDQPIAGDWDGDGVDTIGVYRPSTGLFLLRNSNSAGNPNKSFYLGNVGDIGIAGDWDGDGKDTTGVFRPINGIIFLKNTNETGYADVALNYGIPGDKPVTGDWDNDGTDTIGVYRKGIFLLRNSNSVGFADISFGLGNPGDMPIAGNWDGRP